MRRYASLERSQISIFVKAKLYLLLCNVDLPREYYHRATIREEGYVNVRWRSGVLVIIQSTCGRVNRRPGNVKISANSHPSVHNAVSLRISFAVT